MALRNKILINETSLAKAFAHPCITAVRMRHLYVQILLQTVCELQLAHSSDRCEAGSRLCGKWPSIIFILAISGFRFELSSSGPCDTPTLWAIVEIYFSQHPSFATAPFSRRSFWTGLSKACRALLIYFSYLLVFITNLITQYICLCLCSAVPSFLIIW
jgi:hypothetical protein